MSPESKVEEVDVKVTDEDKAAESPMARAFGAIQKRMVEKFQDRLNNPEEDDCIRHLVLGERFHEEFELAKVGEFILSIQFRNTNEEEEAFASTLSLLNKELITIQPETTPRTDESRRGSILLALAVESIGATRFDPIELADVRDKIKESKLNDDKFNEDLSTNFMLELDDRIVQIKRRLPRGGYSIALRAFQVWLNYQTALLTGTKLENF